MIVVTTPAGQIGKSVVRKCLATQERIRVVERDPSRLPDEFRDRVEVIPGSHGDAAVIGKALAGADALFWLVPPQPRSDSAERDYIDFTRPAANAVERCQVRYVVNVQAIAAGTRWEENAGLATVSKKMGDVLAARSAHHRSLSAPSLMENVLMQLTSIQETGTFFGPIDASRKMPHVACRDVGAIAGLLLTDRSWTGRADLPVLGPEDLSFDDMAAIISDVLGKKVRYQEVSFEAYEQQLSDRGTPASYVRGLVEMMRAKNDGLDNATRRTAESSTPTTFQRWCEEVLRAAIHHHGS